MGRNYSGNYTRNRMLDIRDQPLNVGDRVYSLEFSSGSVHKYEAEIVGLTRQKVRLAVKRPWRQEAEITLRDPKYIVKR